MIDLRDHLEELEKTGELLNIHEEIHWNLEVAVLASMSNRVGGQAIHFNNIVGYPQGYSLAANLLTGPPLFYEHKRSTWGRLATALGLDSKTNYDDLCQTIIDRQNNPILPIQVKTGVVKEVICTGEEIDLFKFPLPFFHQDDGGRYGTGHVSILKDLESDWQNWGAYRWMAVGPDTLVCNFDIGRDAKTIYGKYQRGGKPMPFAIAIGGPPAVLMAAAMTIPSSISESEYAGGLNLDPINLVKAESGELLVPADAEIIIEGEFVPGQSALEGPYGGIVGYTKPSLQPLGRVTTITHRKDPIFPIIVDGTKVSDTQVILSLLESVRLLKEMREVYQHPIRWINLVPDFGLGLCMVSMTNMYPGQGFRVARHIFNTSNFFDKILFVDFELEPVSVQAVANLFASRLHPTRGIHVLQGYPPTLLNRYVTEECREKGMAAGRVYMDTCWPAHWGPEDRPTANTWEIVFDKNTREKVLRRWKEYGFKEEPKTVPEGRRFEG